MGGRSLAAEQWQVGWSSVNHFPFQEDVMSKTYTTPQLVAKGSAVDITTATQIGADDDGSGIPQLDRYVAGGVGFLL